MPKSALKKIRDNLPKLKGNLKAINALEVLVGVPAAKTARKDGTTNASLAMIHDTGSPARNIPARPFMKPGIEAAKPEIVKAMKEGAVEGKTRTALTKAGFAAQTSIKAVITAGIPPELKPSTIANRYRQRKTKGQRKGEKHYKKLLGEGMAAKEAQSAAGLIPLVNTGALLNSITYVIKEK